MLLGFEVSHSVAAPRDGWLRFYSSETNVIAQSSEGKALLYGTVVGPKDDKKACSLS